MDILCSDKTGTLTLNKLTVEQSSVNPFGQFTREDVIKYAALSAQRNSEEAIDVVRLLHRLYVVVVARSWSLVPAKMSQLSLCHSCGRQSWASCDVAIYAVPSVSFKSEGYAHTWCSWTVFSKLTVIVYTL